MGLFINGCVAMLCLQSSKKTEAPKKLSFADKLQEKQAKLFNNKFKQFEQILYV